MADTKESSVSSIHGDPNFAVICSFLTKYGCILGFPDISFEQLEKWIDDTRYVNESLKDMLVCLLRRWRKSIKEDRWTQYLVKFCYTYSQIDAWELEGFGFQRCKTETKLRIIKNLLECQFDVNAKFKEKINEIPSGDLRCLPIGRDVTGKAYWFLIDHDMNMRIYSEEQDDVEKETWQIIVSDRNQLLSLITTLQHQNLQQNEKSRSATPSTVASDVLGIDTCSQDTQPDGCISEFTSDAPHQTLLKCDRILKIDCGSPCPVVRKAEGQSEDVDQSESVTLKLEPTDGQASESLVKADNAESHVDAKHQLMKPNDPDVKVNETLLKTSLNVKVEPTEPAILTANDKTATGNEESTLLNCNKISEVDNGGTEICETVLRDNVVRNKTNAHQSQDLSGVSKPLDDRLLSASSQNGVVCTPSEVSKDGEINGLSSSVFATNDDSVDTPQRNSPRKFRRRVDRSPSSVTAECTVLKMSAKRKRASCRTLSSSSSDDAGDANAQLSESELSDSPASDSRTQSAGEEEPPTKRKRDKALKTASERDRKLFRIRAVIAAKSPGSPVLATNSAPIDQGQGNHDTDKGQTENDCVQGTNEVVVEENVKKSSNERNSPEITEVPVADETVNMCLQQNGSVEDATQINGEKHDEGTVRKQSADMTDSPNDVEPRVAPGMTNCQCVSADNKSREAGRDLESCAENGSGTSAECENEITGTSESDNISSEPPKKNCEQGTESIETGVVSDTKITELATDRVDTDEKDTDKENKELNVDGDTTKMTEDQQKVSFVNGCEVTSAHCENENETEVVGPDGVAGEVVSETPKKRRGRTKKAGRKGRKKRGHSNTQPAAQSSEVGETDYEPTKKIGRPTKQRKSRVAQIIDEGRESVTQSEDDIPLIELAHRIPGSDDATTSMELRRSTRANKGQRKLDQIVVVEQPRKRNKAKEEKLRKREEKIEKRRKREAELQEQAALKAKKKKRGKSDSDDEFVPGKKNGGRKTKGRGGRKHKGSDTESDESSDETDDIDELFDPETEEEPVAASSESDHLDSDGSEYVPRGRNAKRAAAMRQKADAKALEEAEAVQDSPCTRCGKSDQPELILLCDRCDAGYHTACLRPPIMVIPEDEWFCPHCEHNLLIEKLREQLEDYDKKAKQNVRLTQRKERLAFVTVNITNIIKDNDRRAALKINNQDIYDSEETDGSESARSESKTNTNTQTLPQKRRKNRRQWQLSESSSSAASASSSSDEEEEDGQLSDEPRRRERVSARRGVDLSSDGEESWSAMRRSRRQRKQISYKFEEFEELISGAIEDDVKEQREVETINRPSRGKDMANITGIPTSPLNDGSVGKRKKRSRHLTQLDSDETEVDDDSEEFQLSENEDVSSADEDDAGDNGDEYLSDDWSVTRGSGLAAWRKPTRSSDRRRRPTRLNDFVNDDSDEEEDDSCTRRTRRAAAQRQINYHEISESDSAGSDAPRKSVLPERHKNIWSSRQPRRLKDSDSEYQPSSDDDIVRVPAETGLSVTTGRHKRLGSTSDEGSTEAVSKKKGRLNRIVSSSESENSNSENNACDNAEAEKDSAANEDVNSSKTVDSSTAGTREVLLVGTGKVDCDLDTPVCNAASENNKGFTIANLLKNSSSSTSKPNKFEEDSRSVDLGPDDSLSGIEDLVSYVTQS